MSTTGRGVGKQLFGLEGPLDRRTYLLTGLALFALKYAIDVAIVLAATGELWSPVNYLVQPWSRMLPSVPTGVDESALYAALALVSLPFAWIGMAMTMRRCADAGIRPVYALLFFIPFIKYLMIAALCIPPSQGELSSLRPAQAPKLLGKDHALFFGVISGVTVLVLALAFAAIALESYGAALFVGAPFVSGFVSARVLTERQASATGARCIGVAVLSVVAASTAFLLIAWEGVLCIMMALPIAGAFAAVGSLFGHAYARGPRTASPVLVLLALWPLLTAAEAYTATPQLREVLSAIEVDRAPADVWPHVIAFSPLPEPTEWLFKTGIAYPMRARIEGEGEGAVRYCEFSTGAFVEPITVWRAPEQLAFSVREQPRPMNELSPYEDLLAPHLDSALRSQRGEFLLIALPEGRTRIEARTWYTLDMYPSRYWHVWSDAIIHRIHLRVLEHVRKQAEAQASR
jgi:uncharacterized membrane protein YhaH (DUF805 family)